MTSSTTARNTLLGSGESYIDLSLNLDPQISPKRKRPQDEARQVRHPANQLAL